MEQKVSRRERVEKLQMCSKVVVSLAKNATGVSLSPKKTQLFLKVATEQFLFQPTWMGLEWSCRCISNMYWRFSFRKKGTSGAFYDVYYDFETEELSVEL